MNNLFTLISGIDYPIPECSLVIHQPVVRDIALIGETNFFEAIQLICIDKKNYSIEDFNVASEEEFLQITNFTLFMQILNIAEMAEKKVLVQNVLSLFFPQYKITFSPGSLLFNKDQDFFIINESNFEFLQTEIKNISNFNILNDEPNYNPSGAKAAEIAEKLKKARAKILKQKTQENTSNSLFSEYVSILAVGLHYPIADLLQLTIFQLFDLMTRYSLYINWDLDIRTRLAGGNPDSPPENWMKPIHN